MSCFSLSTFADIVKVLDASTIDSIQSYPSYAGGAVVIRFTGVSGCSTGAHVLTTDPAGKESISLALAAYMAGKKVTIYGDTGQPWNGQNPSGAVCHLYTIKFDS